MILIIKNWKSLNLKLKNTFYLDLNNISMCTEKKLYLLVTSRYSLISKQFYIKFSKYS